jgi:hypothetical protein
MTAELFKELIAKPGDTNALRKELAALPFWQAATATVTMKYQDGKIFTETIPQTAKTVAGQYIVFSGESQYYHQNVYAIIGYDEAATAIHEWGLFGKLLTESTIIFDFTNRVSASASQYGDGFMEISAGTYSDTAMTDHTVVYKNGALFMTRDSRSAPATKQQPHSRQVDHQQPLQPPKGNVP